MSAPVVVKLGGELVAEPRGLAGLATALARAVREGEPLVVVHGGGPQVSALSERLGARPELVNGRRITDGVALEAVKLALAGKIRSEIVAALQARGLRAVGVSGIDAGMLQVRRRPVVAVPDGTTVRRIDFGFVGDVHGVDPSLLLHLLRDGYVPVLAPLAADRAGTILNVNADTVASALAVALRAKRFVVLTAVPGVYRDFPNRKGRERELTVDQAERMLSAGVAAGGMHPKLAACVVAVRGGVREARIASGRSSRAVHGAVVGAGGAGTRVSGVRG
jgi:acetylglutamate kinase